jgi:hypothetical protein
MAQTVFEVDVPELGIQGRFIKYPRQVIHPPYKKQKPTSVGHVFKDCEVVADCVGTFTHQHNSIFGPKSAAGCWRTGGILRCSPSLSVGDWW